MTSTGTGTTTIVPLKVTIGMGDAHSEEQQHPPSKLDLSGGSCCCGRVTAEVRHPPFDETEVNGPTLHGPATFAPAGTWTLLAKTVITLWSASVMVQGILAIDPKVFYVAYLTNWSLIVTILYMTLSWMLTIRTTVFVNNNKNINLNKGNAKTTATTDSDVTWLHRLVWGLFCIAAPAEIVVTAGYWGLEWDGTTAGFYYRNFMVHGVILGLLLVQGLVLDKIPLRIGHIWFLWSYLFAYLIWTFVHAYLQIGNPSTPEDDDTIYTALQWRQDPTATAIVAGQFLLILAPIAFCIVYSLSLYSFPCGCNGQSRRYLNNTGTNKDTASTTKENSTTASYVEMGALETASI